MERPGELPSGASLELCVIGSVAASADLTRVCADAGLRCTVIAPPTSADNADLPARAAPLACAILIRIGADASTDMQRVLRAYEPLIPSNAVYAADTSNGSLAELARAALHPERIVGVCLSIDGDGIRFVEIVRGVRTSAEALSRVLDFMTRIGKTSIVVNDSKGLFVSRVIGAYVNEGLALVGDGVPAAQVERAANEAGMSRGPLAVLDEQSLKAADEALHRELEELEHGHGHEHGHDHGHEHGDAQGHGHEHSHDHGHGHAHGHGHGHGHAHDHGHVHANGGNHGHAHAPAHGHKHEHGHQHVHGPSCGHDHAASHDHDHGHAHGHGHGHAHDAGHHHAPTHEGQPARAQASAQRHVHKVKSKRMPESAVYVLEKMAHGFKRMGRASGAGFYDYTEGEAPQLWSGLKTFERGARQISEDDVRDRLLYALALEVVRCLQEGVVDSNDDADKASVLGAGFPASAGGAIGFVNAVGVVQFVERTGALSQRFGPRFDPPALLVDRAQRGIPL